MMEADPAKKLMSKAGALMARRSYSRGELRDKLAKHGEAPQIETVLDRLEQLNLLNDAEYAYNSAVRWMRQEGWGTIKIRSTLLRRQVSGPIAEAATERVQLEFGEKRSLESYLDRRDRIRPMPGNRKGVHKLMLSLQRRGFNSETIWEVLRERIPASAWENFETGE
jgi:regulatory protein